MDRKEWIKTMLLGAASFPLMSRKELQNQYIVEKPKSGVSMRSKWERWPDIEWAGPRFWGNRLQDWQLRDGRAQCSVSENNRRLHCLTHQLSKGDEAFATDVNISLLNRSNSDEDYVGFRVGAIATDKPVPVTFQDYRRAAVFGEGLDVGLSTDGRLFIGEMKSIHRLDLAKSVNLQLKGERHGKLYQLSLAATSLKNGKILDQINTRSISPEELAGNLALVSHFQAKQEASNSPSAQFSDWQISGPKVTYRPKQTYGPICFAQYTLDRQLLKMTAQMAPVEKIEGHSVEFQIKEDNNWKTLQEATVHRKARTAHFRFEDWDEVEAVPYRLKLELPLRKGTETFYYEGTIASNPVEKEQLKTAVFSCNCHYGFPNNEVVCNAEKHNPDMAVFLGDQIYESTGGFGIQRAPLDKACLDFLYKWYMFGWSYRDIFRHRPVAFLTDDHDVYHGNIWGQGGKEAPTYLGWGYASQDRGGYKMLPEWVNMVQTAVTSHLPDPYDPTPVKQNIGVYYTDWTYGGVSFALLEDRKFKTAPENAFPPRIDIDNGFVQNPDFDVTEWYDIEANLLGERQLTFLDDWANDWSDGAEMKGILSQTNLCGITTLPKGSRTKSDRIVPDLPIPERGEYVQGDAPTVNMDTNGWPQKRRDRAIRRFRKAFAFHITGDQHLASMEHYGVDEFGDSGFAFAGPALNNIWPRRWWPSVGPEHESLPGRLKNTGKFEDGFGNKFTLYAVGNPVQSYRKPGIIYDRATGYGMVTFNKAERTINVECWPRYVDPEANPDGQFEGWPIIIDQQDNYGREATAWLPEIVVEGMQDPVIEIYRQDTMELVYALRIKGQQFKPKVFASAAHTIRVGDPDQQQWQEFEKVRPGQKQRLQVVF